MTEVVERLKWRGWEVENGEDGRRKRLVEMGRFCW